MPPSRHLAVTANGDLAPPRRRVTCAGCTLRSGQSQPGGCPSGRAWEPVVPRTPVTRAEYVCRHASGNHPRTPSSATGWAQTGEGPRPRASLSRESRARPETSLMSEQRKKLASSTRGMMGNRAMMMRMFGSYADATLPHDGPRRGTHSPVRSARHVARRGRGGGGSRPAPGG